MEQDVDVRHGPIKFGLRLGDVAQAPVDEWIGERSARPLPQEFAKRGALVEHIVEVAGGAKLSKEFGEVDAGGQHRRAGFGRESRGLCFWDALGEAPWAGHFGEDGLERIAVERLRVRAEAAADAAGRIAPRERFVSCLGSSQVPPLKDAFRFGGFALPAEVRLSGEELRPQVRRTGPAQVPTG